MMTNPNPGASARNRLRVISTWTKSDQELYNRFPEFLAKPLAEEQYTKTQRIIRERFRQLNASMKPRKWPAGYGTII